MDNLEYRKLNKSDEAAYLAFINEFIEAGERLIPASIDPKGETFLAWLDKSEKTANGIDLPADRVPASTFFLLDKESGKILGAVNIRHELNDFLLKKGGNIGYGVAPSERRKGYASLMLEKALDNCLELGMEKVMVSCDKYNIGSNKTIQKNGGVLENEATEEDGNVFCRYWIDLK